MDYYDLKQKRVYTEYGIIGRGLPLDNTILSSVGIYPLDYAYKSYNDYTQKQLPDGDPVFNGTEYVQYFKVEELTGEGLESGLKRQERDYATTRLIKIDEESVRPLRALRTGFSIEFDREKLYTLEVEALTLRQILSDTPLSENKINEHKIRIWRDILLDSTAWQVERYNEQTINQFPSSITEQQYKELLVYRQALRDLPQQDGFPWGGDTTIAPFPPRPTFV